MKAMERNRKQAARFLIAGWLAVGGVYGQAGVTFFATSDVHYGQNSATKDANRAAIAGHLNSLAGKAYPASAGGGLVGTPRGVVLPGDLIENSAANLWRDYSAAFGIRKEGAVKLPVYDALGNHEFYGSTFNAISSAFRQRNLERKNDPAYSIKDLDSSNYHYSWEWDGIFFVNLNVFGGAPKGFVNGTPNAFGSLDFLRRTLEKHVGRSGRPVIAVQHFPFEDGDSWMPASDRTATIAVLKQYNCIGILHGHTHRAKFYKYDGIDIYDDGTAMNGDHLVFRIANRRLLVLNRVKDAWGALRLEKEISMGAPTGLEPPKPGEGRLPAFRLTVEGAGEIYAGRSAPASVEIFTVAGRAVQSLPVAGSSLAWNRRDASGRAVPAGVYVFRIRAASGTLHVKAAL